MFVKSQDSDVTLNPAKVAEQIHAVIEANRTIYATHVVDKLQAKGIVTAAEYWKQEDVLPLPAQFLIETGRLMSEKGTGLKYRLASLWPIYVWKTRLPPISNGRDSKPSQKTRRSLIPDLSNWVGNAPFRLSMPISPISQSCIDCHNAHPNSPRRDFKLNDVTGGVVITIPVEE